MGAMVSQITSLTIVYSTVYSGADQRKHQSSASLAFVRGIHRSPVNSPHKWPVTLKMLPFDGVITQTENWDEELGETCRLPAIAGIEPCYPYQVTITHFQNGVSIDFVNGYPIFNAPFGLKLRLSFISNRMKILLLISCNPKPYSDTPSQIAHLKSS